MCLKREIPKVTSSSTTMAQLEREESADLRQPLLNGGAATTTAAMEEREPQQQQTKTPPVPSEDSSSSPSPQGQTPNQDGESSNDDNTQNDNSDKDIVLPVCCSCSGRRNVRVNHNVFLNLVLSVLYGISGS